MNSKPIKIYAIAGVLAATLGTSIDASAQPPTTQPQRSAREVAPVDLTGYWVSPVMEDWRWRMVTPIKGDAASMPMRPEAFDVMDRWDPAEDEANGLECKGYGAPALMRIPGRLLITWQDDNTLKIDTDAGSQTRVFYFAETNAGDMPASRQGHSAARWDAGVAPPPTGLGFFGGGGRVGGRSKTLEVHTTNLLPGYLRKNGVPYSEQTTVMEYFDRFDEPDGTEWFTVTTVVTDPVYLGIPFVTTTDFRREPDDSGWNPKPCSAY
jgi:hypothetical protein